MKFGRSEPNGGKMAAKKWLFVLRDTVKSRFFVTGQIGMKFRQNMSVGVLYRTLIEKFRKILIIFIHWSDKTSSK